MNADLNGNRNHFKDSQAPAAQPLPDPDQFWKPADVTNLVNTVLKAVPPSSNVNVRVNGRNILTTEEFRERAAAVLELRKAGPPQQPARRTRGQRSEHMHVHQHQGGGRRKARRPTRRTAAAPNRRAPQQRRQHLAHNSKRARDPTQGPVGQPPGNPQQGPPPQGSGGGGGVYNVDSNFGPVFGDGVTGDHQADDNDNDNNDNNDNDNDNNNNNEVQVSGGGNSLKHNVREVNYNLNLNLNYNDNQNDNYDAANSKPATSPPAVERAEDVKSKLRK